MTLEYWCDLLSKMEVKYNRKRAATHINNITSARAASLSEIDEPVRIPKKRKARLGAVVLRSNKGSHNKAPKHHGTQRDCMICKKERIPEQKFMLHSAEDCFVKCTNQETIKDRLGGPMGSRAEYVKQYKKSKSKCKKYMKALKKQNKMLFSIAKKYGLRRELKKIKKIILTSRLRKIGRSVV